VTVLVEYGQDTTDPAKCRRSALDEIADGAGVLFEAAGACGEGVLQAAAAKRIPVIATDRTVPAASHWVLTVALKRVDVAVRASVLAAQLGRLRGGKNLRFGVAQDGVGYGAWGPFVSARIREAVAAQLELLKARKVKTIPTTLG
jgi:basic membrane protein A